MIIPREVLNHVAACLQTLMTQYLINRRTDWEDNGDFESLDRFLNNIHWAQACIYILSAMPEPGLDWREDSVEGGVSNCPSGGPVHKLFDQYDKSALTSARAMIDDILGDAGV